MNIIEKYKLNTTHNIINPAGGIIKGVVVGYKKEADKVTHVLFSTKYHPKESPLKTPIRMLPKKIVPVDNS